MRTFAKTFWLYIYHSDNLCNLQLLFPDFRRLLGTTEHITVPVGWPYIASKALHQTKHS